MALRSRTIISWLVAGLIAVPLTAVVTAPQAIAADSIDAIDLQLGAEFNSVQASPSAAVTVTARITEAGPPSGPSRVKATFSAPLAIDFDVESIYLDGRKDPTDPDDTCTIPVGGSSCSVNIPSGGDKGTAQIRAWIDRDGKNGDTGITEADRTEGRLASASDDTNASADDCVSGPDATTPEPNDSGCRAGTPVAGSNGEGDQTDVGEISFFDASFPTLSCVEVNSGRSGTAGLPVAVGAGQNVKFRCSALNGGGGPIGSVPIDAEALNPDGTNGGPNDPDQSASTNTTADFNSQNPANPLGDAGCLTTAAGTCEITIPGKATGRAPELGVLRVCFWGDTTGFNQGNGAYTDGGPATDGGQCKGTITSLTRNTFISWQEAVGVDGPVETSTVEKGQTVRVTANLYAEDGNPSFGAPKPRVFAELFSGSAGDVDGNKPSTADYEFPAVAAGESTTTLEFPANTAGTIVMCIWTAQTPVLTGKVGGSGSEAPSCEGVAGAEATSDATGDNGVPSPANDNTDIVTRTVTNPPEPPTPPGPTSGYWLLEQSARVTEFNAPNHGSGGLSGSTRAVAIVARGKTGYWLAGADGSVAAKGSATNFGNATALNLQQPIVGMAARPQGDGYWLLGSDGGIFSYGPGAAFYGSTGGIKLNKPVVGIAATPTGNGYWLVASDGGIFAYGDAVFAGSMGAVTLQKPVVGMTAPITGGYLLVASDGGIFAFGGAGFHGSTGNIVLQQPIVGMTSRDDGNGYWMVATDGGVFAFDAPFHSSLVGRADFPVVGMASYGST